MNYKHRVLEIPSATPEETDASQYIIRHGRKQFNICGEMAVAYVTQDTANTSNIDDFLDYWQVKDLSLYQSLFKNGLARTTGVYDLDRMLADYDYKTPSLRFGEVPIAPLSVKEMLYNYQAIVGVQIDHTGYLVGRGIPHWIVLEDMDIIDSTHSIVKIYNPYTNAEEPFSWRELMNSTGVYKNGIWVRRILETNSGVLPKERHQ